MRRALLLFVLLLGCDDGDDRRGEDPALLVDRVWIDHIPESRTEYIQAMFVLGERPLGIFQRGSNYDIHFELFFYGRNGAKMTYRFPQSDKRGDFSYRIRACDQPPFDLCLELSKNPWGGPKKYYGMREEDESLRRIRAELTRHAR